MIIVHIDSLKKWFDMYRFADELYITNDTIDAMGNEVTLEYNLNMMSRYQAKLALQLSILRNDGINYVNVIKYAHPVAKLYELSFDFEALRVECSGYRTEFEDVVL